jgi:hypothetical protein
MYMAHLTVCNSRPATIKPSSHPGTRKQAHGQINPVRCYPRERGTWPVVVFQYVGPAHVAIKPRDDFNPPPLSLSLSPPPLLPPCHAYYYCWVLLSSVGCRDAFPAAKGKTHDDTYADEICTMYAI